MRQTGLEIASIGALVLLGGMSLAQVPAAKLPTKGPTRISSYRPVADAADLLRHLYGKVVTYEETPLTWQGELIPYLLPEPKRDPNHPWLTWRQEAFVMPPETGIEPNLAVVLDRTLQAYHQQAGMRRFQVLTSDWGYHIVPAQTHDDRGAFAPAASVLDLRISVADEERTPIGHLKALAAAIRVAGGTPTEAVVQSGRGFDSVFRSTPAQFKWGVSAAVARDALIDLLSRSATTMLWDLRCGNSAKAEDRTCAINMSNLEITTTDASGKPVNRTLTFDRCGGCKSIPEGRR